MALIVPSPVVRWSCPTVDFLEAAEAAAYDIESLGRQFGVGYETVCHRLSTLQRTDARGVPFFFFIRADRAGNISKRRSATDFHFSHVGGSCPVWNLYEAFASPGRIQTQRADAADSQARGDRREPHPIRALPCEPSTEGIESAGYLKIPTSSTTGETRVRQEGRHAQLDCY